MTCFAQQTHTIHGTVYDSTGAVVRGATVTYVSGNGRLETQTDEKGEFSLSGEDGGTLEASLPGFASDSVQIKPHTTAENIRLTLTPAPNQQRIEVTGGEPVRIPATPSSDYGIPTEEVQNAGSLVLDDILRQVPGFSTYRRSSSLYANPSSQGVSLRGVGASATSRSIVTVDGIPANDAFGGWVYWGRVPRVGVDSMEVINGGSSDLYGGGALGGVVKLRTKETLESYGDLELSYGSMNTPDVSFSSGISWDGWTISAMGQAMKTGGYIPVPEAQRGSVDANVNTGDLTGIIEVAHAIGERGRFFVRGSDFGESRDNGTVLQENNTTLPEVDLGADWSSADWGSFSARLYGTTERYHQTFSAVAADRNSESLTDNQETPSQQVGFIATWSKLFAEKHNVAAGFEAHDVRGHSEETNYVKGVESALVDAGGRQHSFGFYGQDTVLFARTWVLTLGARVDTWNNNSGYQERVPLISSVTPINQTFPSRTESAFSPKVTLTRNFSNGIAASASVYQAFRAPTLNELYRNFRVGNTITLANPALTGEHLTGGEAGLSMQRWKNRLTVRGNFFWSDINKPVANVTLSSTPSLIIQQKENLGTTQAIGFELSGQVQLNPRMQIAGSYLFVNSTVSSFSANPVLVGLRLPEVPQNSFGLQFSYAGKNWNAGVQARFMGQQYENDLNTLPMGRGFSLDSQVSRQILPHTALFFAAQNLTNDRFITAVTPTAIGIIHSVGPPIFVRGGVRLAF